MLYNEINALNTENYSFYIGQKKKQMKHNITERAVNFDSM